MFAVVFGRARRKAEINHSNLRDAQKMHFIDW